MGKSNLLTSLSLDVETFKAHLKRISKEDYKVHQLDKDLLLEKTRQLYDNILQIEVEGKQEPEVKKPIDKPVEPEKKTEKQPKVETAEEIAETVIEMPIAQSWEIDEKAPENKEVENTEEEKVIENPIEDKQEVNIGFKKPEEVRPTENTTESQPEPQSQPESQPQPIPQPSSEAQPKKESAYDLFSPSSNTVSDKFTSDEDKSIAGKLKQNKLDDLREAIGINEKFLFINELFAGDMGRYNKALDEINSMQSKTGSDTYLMELKIEKQWDTESDAFIKFKELVDRKFH
ncbi:MAG: hypothetical protein C0598_11900 [Marinilabiliales bacterium]|nr:MAG: hypothetical protein C0598_11900 [Marinilabiliales bacterium]